MRGNKVDEQACTPDVSYKCHWITLSEFMRFKLWFTIIQGDEIMHVMDMSIVRKLINTV